MEVASDEFGRVIDVNLKGVHPVIRAFIIGMIQRGKDVVVHCACGCCAHSP